MAFDASSENQPLGMASTVSNPDYYGCTERKKVLAFLNNLGITDSNRLEVTITTQKTCEPSIQSN